MTCKWKDAEGNPHDGWVIGFTILHGDPAAIIQLPSGFLHSVLLHNVQIVKEGL